MSAIEFTDDDIIECKECKYRHDCPCGWSKYNSACLIIQRKDTEMEYFETSVNKYAIGNPSDEEREKLTKDGYTFMVSGKKAYYPHDYYEIWMK